MKKAWGTKHFVAALFWILTKQPTNIPGVEVSRTIPFLFNRIQTHLVTRLARNNRVLKARQAGMTTFLMLVRLLLNVITEGGKTGLLISQNADYATKHFQIARRAYRLIGAQDPTDDSVNGLCQSLKANLLHTTYSNRKELVFDMLDSRLIVESAEVQEAGQGVTLHHVLSSETARWPSDPEATTSNVKGALVPNGTYDEESTGNSATGYFYEQYLRSMDNETKADARSHFYGWWWSDEYEHLDLSKKQTRELEKDLTETEMNLIKKIRAELGAEVGWNAVRKISWRRQAVIEQRGNFDEKYPEDPITAFLLSGNAYFDKDVLVARKRELFGYKPFRVYSNGEAQLFKRVIPNRRYVIGADVATGRTISSDDTDYCAAVVLDLETGEEVGAYRARVTPYDFALDLDDLGRYFNSAVIAVERTGDGGTTILALQGECKYGAIYKHKDWHKRERKVVEFEGFPTTPKTRPIALNFVNQHILDHPDLIWDEQFINEALIFVRDEKGVPRAQAGGHDDRVSARWIGHAARRALLGWWDAASAKSERYISSDQLLGSC